MKVFWIVSGILFLGIGTLLWGPTFLLVIAVIGFVAMLFIGVGAFMVGCLHALARSIDDDLQNNRRNRNY